MTVGRCATLRKPIFFFLSKTFFDVASTRARGGDGQERGRLHIDVATVHELGFRVFLEIRCSRPLGCWDSWLKLGRRAARKLKL